MENKTIEELLERRAQIAVECETDGADLNALEEEVRNINAELERRKAVEAERAEIREQVANGDGETIKEFKEERETTMTIKELRSSESYLNAWVEGIKNDRYDECRKLLTDNALEANIAEGDGIVPVPTYVEDRINAMWENNDLLNRVRRTYFRGNVKVGFEASSTGASNHVEGAAAIDDEQLLIGIVNLIPTMVKKTIRLSDELIDMRGEAFIDYLFDEFTNKIEAFLVGSICAVIDNAPAISDTSAVGVPVIEADAITLDLIAQALGQLTADNANPVCVMNRATYAAFRAAALNANYSVDVFEGCPVVFTSALPSITDASAGDTYVIVGDMSAVQANFPNGDDVKFVYDPYTEANKDLVRITGRLYVAIGVTTPGMLCKIAKED